MLNERLYDMGITELITEKDRIKAHKERELEKLGVMPNEIEAQIDRDLEIKELVELILDKAKTNRAKKGLKQCL